jgi:thymidylate synthase ThyX
MGEKMKKNILDKIKELKHTERPILGGGTILILDNGALIDSEAEAMIQALYSRDPRSVREHLNIVAEKGPEKFMADYYVGFGHKSIGDCGSGTIFFEGISMLAVKAIQDWMLYSGQEVSTRYLDFAKQPFVDPIGTKESREWLEKMRAFYVCAGEPLRSDLKRRFPKCESEKDSIYNKAIFARSFDILRSFLPAGASTSVSWHTNLRQAADKLMLLRHHPLAEVKNIAIALESALEEKFPGSFLHERFEATEKYNQDWMKHMYLTNCSPVLLKKPDAMIARSRIDKEELKEWRHFLETRPPKTELPKVIGQCGTMKFNFLLDFGSFRDIQRHRAIIQCMPLLTTKFGFEPWYLSELPNILREEAEKLLGEHKKEIEKSFSRQEVLQYYIPMGYRVPNQLSGDLPALVYLAELRATRFVHPTLQKRAHQMADILKRRFGKFGLKIYVDSEIGRFDVQRGEQDIIKK